MLDAAVRDRRLASNPVAGVDLPRLPRKERRYLDRGEVAGLAEACGPYRPLVLVLAYCGLRWGEAAALRVRRVDTMRGRLDVAESLTEINGEAVFGTPKSHQSRSVPVPAFLRDILAERVAGLDADALVFSAPRGGVLRVGNFRRRYFDRAARAVGLDGLVPHELRHTAASLAIAAGASVKGIQAMLGHASATLTLDQYGHLFGDELDAVADRIDAAARAAADFSRTFRGLAADRTWSRYRPARRSSGLTCGKVGAPGRIRTCDARFRKPTLYPLSYGGVRTSLARGSPYPAGCWLARTATQSLASDPTLGADNRRPS
jgi:site-specific recombinase XerC